MMDIPLRRDNLSTQIAEFLRNYIARNELKPGDALPSEVEISKQADVSRTVVREAIRVLSAAGLVAVANGRRPQVSALNGEVLSGFFTHALVTRQASAEQILELRRGVELATARLAAARRQPENVENLKKLILLLESNLNNVNTYIKHDYEFHLEIARSTKNRLFELLLASLRNPMEESMKTGMRSRKSKNELIRIQELHHQIFKAIESGDFNKAERAMVRHFDDAVKAILERSKAQGSRAALRAYATSRA